VTPTIRQLRDRLEAVRKAELDKTLKVFGDDITKKQKKSLEMMTQAIVNKMLHEPTLHLKRLADNSESDVSVDAVRQVFGLVDEDKKEDPA
jgi:glutamyl-tRNA reductase